MSENEYKDWVLAEFDQKRDNGLLSSELLSPTPGGLKAECVKICEGRYSTKDEILLSSFFNQRKDAYEYRQAILNSSADIFRPLVSFLRDRSRNTALKNVNLLAWLIDFKPRPYHPGLIYTKQPSSPVSTQNPQSAATPPIIPPIRTTPQNGNAVNTFKKKKAFYIFLVIPIALAIYFITTYNSHQLTGREGCMLWKGDHYEPAECGMKSPYYQLCPINRRLITNFKKITSPDTLTLRSIGKVWYAKFKGRVEFYTAGGVHPLDTNRRLLPLSDHILKKYVYHMTD